MSARRLVGLGAVLTALVVACTEQPTAPGQCPAYCPTRPLTLVDTLLATSITKDSAFRGYVLPNRATVLLGANLPGIVDSRPIWRFGTIGPRLIVLSTDTTQGTIEHADSARLQFYITRRDTAERGLTLSVYRLPVTIDTTTTFAQLAGPFTDSLVRTVTLDSLLARPARRDSVTGDTIHVDPVTGDSVVVDTLKRMLVSLKLDSSEARYVAADTGKVAYGIRLSADSLASVLFGKDNFGATLQWYLVADSVGVPVKRTAPSLRGTTVATFVFSPPAAPLDSTLAVGGVPAARSVLRVALSRPLRDSVQFVRATLLLVPAVAARGTRADSFLVQARTVYSDFGAKSPVVVDLAHTDSALIHIGATDTVRIEITNLLQLWQSDTTKPTTIVLSAKPEGSDFAEIRFYPSVAAAFRPAIRLTYLLRYPFGQP
ncbi:MAG TPA: hypothetical protein VEU55_07320 [Gemmatimonadales bacterium]|nr:hypothetical protein [Gemmatimonadales bacterium]